jgi:hypothetical protein
MPKDYAMKNYNLQVGSAALTVTPSQPPATTGVAVLSNVSVGADFVAVSSSLGPLTQKSAVAEWMAESTGQYTVYYTPAAPDLAVSSTTIQNSPYANQFGPDATATSSNRQNYKGISLTQPDRKDVIAPYQPLPQPVCINSLQPS